MAYNSIWAHDYFKSTHIKRLWWWYSMNVRPIQSSGVSGDSFLAGNEERLVFGYCEWDDHTEKTKAPDRK